jgi:YD repeat-containing protein
MSYIGNMDYLIKISQGLVVGAAAWNKLGYNGDVDNVEEDVISQGGVYVWPAAEQQMDIVSDSTKDDGSPAGLGAQKVTLYYLNLAGAEKSEEITMNGTTAVATSASDIYRVQNMRVTAVGAENDPAGNITLSEHGGTTYKYGYIAAGQNRQRQITWTVPAGKALYITSATLSGVNTAASHIARFTLRATYNDKSLTVLAANFFVPFAELQVVDQTVERDFRVPIKLPAGVDIKVSAISDAGASNEIVSCALRGYTLVV